jgi:hypothetical protein
MQNGGKAGQHLSMRVLAYCVQEGYAKRGAKQAAAIKDCNVRIVAMEGSLSQVGLPPT